MLDIERIDAFCQYKTEVDGKEPMPNEVFKEREKVIFYSLITSS